MSRDSPANTSPSGMPSVTARQTVDARGSACDCMSGHGTELGQVTYSPSGKSRSNWPGKGPAWSSSKNGTEYKQVSSKG